MSDEDLLRALGKVAAGQAADRERWEASAARAPLGDRDVPAADDDREELARRLFAPPGDEAVARMADRVFQAQVRRPRVLRWAGIASLPLAAAAAIALLMSRPADLPRYTLSVSGGTQAERGPAPHTEGEPVAVAPGAPLVLLARPDAATTGDVRAATFAMRAGGPVLVPSVSEASAKGSMRVTVQSEDLAKVAGADHLVEIVLVVDRSEAIDRRALAAQDGVTTEWARFTLQARVAGPAR